MRSILNKIWIYGLPTLLFSFAITLSMLSHDQSLLSKLFPIAVMGVGCFFAICSGLRLEQSKIDFKPTVIEFIFTLLCITFAFVGTFVTRHTDGNLNGAFTLAFVSLTVIYGSTNRAKKNSRNLAER